MTLDAVLPRQERLAHQEQVDRARALATFANRPHDERLSAPHVARGEHLRHRRLVVVGVCPDVAAGVARNAELRKQAAGGGTEKAHREQHEVGLELELAARHFDHLRLAVSALLPVAANRDELLDVPGASLETLARYRP